jgi:hypothetical protein
MAWIKLTHYSADKPKDIKDVYVCVEQIVLLRDPVGSGLGYMTNVVCANATIDVIETKTAILDLIRRPNVPMPDGAKVDQAVA